MKAVKYLKYGSPEVISVVEKDLPKAKEDEIVIKVHASSISLAECAFRKADPFVTRLFGGFFAPKVTPGDMFAGEVFSVGSQVDKFQVGDRIYGTTGPTMGAHAQFVKVKSDQAIVHLPAGVDYEVASSLADGAITALPFLNEVANLKKGQHILINGASGGIGTFAIQLAKIKGALVTGVCSGKNLETVKRLGADHVIDYNKEDFTLNKNQYDVVFDTVGKSSFKKVHPALKNDGLYMTTVPTLGLLMRSMFNKDSKKKAKFMATGLRKPHDKLKDFRYLADLADKQELEALIDEVYSLDQIKAAHEYVEKGHKVGNVIIKFW